MTNARKLLPKIWHDKHGPIKLMTQPIDGYVMARRPGCSPFVLSLNQLMNVKPHPILGPFTVGLPADENMEMPNG